MKKMLSLAALIVAMSAGGAMAELPPVCDGTKTGWTSDTVSVGGGDPVTTCYHGGSGNDVDCDSSGNHVAVTVTPGTISYQTLTQPGNSPNPQTCMVAESYTESEPSCDISRTRDVGSTNFDYCD